MDENIENKNENTEEVKEEKSAVSKAVSETVSEVKEATKNINNKENVAVAKKFFTNFFKTPFSQIKDIVSNHKPFFIMAIIILAVWVVAECISGIISVADSYAYSSYYTIEMYMRNSVSSAFTIIKSLLIPIIIVALLSGIIYLFMKDKKKNFLTVLTTVIITKIPVVLASIVGLLGYIGSELYKISVAVSGFCSAFSFVLLYFGIKALYKEDNDDKAIIKFIITVSIFYGIALILHFFGLNIY